MSTNISNNSAFSCFEIGWLFSTSCEAINIDGTEGTIASLRPGCQEGLDRGNFFLDNAFSLGLYFPHFLGKVLFFIIFSGGVDFMTERQENRLGVAILLVTVTVCMWIVMWVQWGAY